MSIDVESLKTERNDLQAALRQLENEQRRLDGEQKKLRQKEIRTKRTLEALDTLIDMSQPDEPEAEN